MQKFLVYSLLALSLFPACKRHSEHTQNGAVSSTRHNKCQKRAKTLPDDTCELVDRSNWGKGVACLAAAPVLMGAGGFATFVAIMSTKTLFLSVLCAPFACAAAVTLAGAGTLIWAGCSFLSDHARMVKAHERARCKVCEKIHIEQQA